MIIPPLLFANRFFSSFSSWVLFKKCLDQTICNHSMKWRKKKRFCLLKTASGTRNCTWCMDFYVDIDRWINEKTNLTTTINVLYYKHSFKQLESNEEKRKKDEKKMRDKKKRSNEFLQVQIWKKNVTSL